MVSLHCLAKFGQRKYGKFTVKNIMVEDQQFLHLVITTALMRWASQAQES